MTSTPRSIFSVQRHFGQHDSAIKALRMRALELMDKVAMAKKHASPSTQSRYLEEAQSLQRAAAYLASLESPSKRRQANAPEAILAA